MKYIISCGMAALLILLTNGDIAAQKPSTKCSDPAIQGIADNIKNGFSKQGYVVFQESMLAMQSMEPTPIAIRLQAGITYQLIFIGSTSASRLSLELFDGSDKRIDEKVEKSDNYILYTFKPQKTEVYLVTLYQKKGVKDMCGYFAVMTPKLKNAPPKTAPVKRSAPATTQKAASPAKQTTTKTTTIKTTTTTTTQKNNTPSDNQRPNSNRTRATKEYQQQQQQR